ncbi:MAG: leucine-rich repeat-containing protein kinase family protein [bacterium]|nr:leucine-rich repeat-containing protein kinase family protein [bacterium]
MQKIPFFHSYDPNSKKLTLRGATYFPKAIFNFADDIEILDAPNGQLTSLPGDFARLNRLRIALFTNNLFEVVPEVLSECPNLSMLSLKSCRISKFAENALPTKLRWLILTQNHLEKLPTSMGDLTNLEKLSLAGNRLQTLPESMVACKRLGLIRISANNFTEPPPDWLFTLPCLSWYGDNGNPFSEKRLSTKNSLLPDIHWDEIEFGDKIGESPSSRVFRGTLKTTGLLIAVKIFKGELTSDGYPADDMSSSVAAGTHPNLIKILGKIIGNPDKNFGLALSLIPATYKSLGLPPDFRTCTRDTFPAKTIFSLPYILTVLKGVASACRHLHSQGIAHGDIYAHNILTDGDGNSLLGDFGAATFYDRSKSSVRERIDVRAFGCLVEDLLGHAEKSNDTIILKKLTNLRQACTNENMSARPLFADIYKTL